MLLARLIALFYLLMAMADLSAWLTNGLAKEPLPNAYAALTWLLYIVGLFALFCFAVRKPFLPKNFWRACTGVYVSVRLFELLSRGLALTGDNLATDSDIILSYLWLVLPPACALLYLSAYTPERRITLEARQRMESESKA